MVSKSNYAVDNAWMLSFANLELFMKEDCHRDDNSSFSATTTRSASSDNDFNGDLASVKSLSPGLTSSAESSPREKVGSLKRSREILLPSAYPGKCGNTKMTADEDEEESIPKRQMSPIVRPAAKYAANFHFNTGTAAAAAPTTSGLFRTAAKPRKSLCATLGIFKPLRVKCVVPVCVQRVLSEDSANESGAAIRGARSDSTDSRAVRSLTQGESMNNISIEEDEEDDEEVSMCFSDSSPASFASATATTTTGECAQVNVRGIESGGEFRSVSDLSLSYSRTDSCEHECIFDLDL
jgi:hypothetical protein